MKVKVTHNMVLASNTMHILCGYCECSLNRFGVITLTRCYDLKGQSHDLEDESQAHL